MGAEVWQNFRNEPLGDGRAWSATYDSYDQYHDDIYFLVTINECVEAAPTPFMVEIDLAWAANLNDWNALEFIDGLRRNLARVAATGKTNTTHTR